MQAICWRIMLRSIDPLPPRRKVRRGVRFRDARIPSPHSAAAARRDWMPLLLPFNMARDLLLYPVDMSQPPAEVPYGTLDLMILRTLDTLGAQHGYGIARRIEQVAQDALALNQG